MPLLLPATGDLVLEGSTRWRIRTLTETVARLRTFDRRDAVVDPRALTWDAGAGLWRTDRCTPTR
jgi:hypothetical protein